MGRFSPSPEFLRHCAAVTLTRAEDDRYLAAAIEDGRAVRGNERHPRAIFINGEGPMLEHIAVQRLRAAEETTS